MFVDVCAGACVSLPPPMVLSDVHAVFAVLLCSDLLFLFSGAVQREYVVKLNDSQEALEKSQRLFEEKKAEMKELKTKLEEFAMDTEDMEVEQTMIHNRATSTSKESSRESTEHKNAVDSYRTKMQMLWEKRISGVAVENDGLASGKLEDLTGGGRDMQYVNAACQHRTDNV